MENPPVPAQSKPGRTKHTSQSHWDFGFDLLFVCLLSFSFKYTQQTNSRFADSWYCIHCPPWQSYQGETHVIKLMSNNKRPMYTLFVPNLTLLVYVKRIEENHEQPLLRNIHWLPVRSRIDYKISTLWFNNFTNSSPEYIAQLLSTTLPDTSVHPRTHASSIFLSSKLSH